VSLGLLSAMGAGAGSFSVLIGAAAQRMPAEARGTASGVINAGGSFGQFVFAPILQKLIQLFGWMGAMWSLALLTLAALPLVGWVTGRAPRRRRMPGSTRRAAQGRGDAMQSTAATCCCTPASSPAASTSPSWSPICRARSTCAGLPPTVASWSLAIIGLANIFGSLYAGSCVAATAASMCWPGCMPRAPC
jgi:predicted MFS family arabinose efflux permease